MMVFTSIYSMVDGLFVSNLVGKTAFAAINLVMPLVFVVTAFGFMLGAGGAALTGRLLGEGKTKEANEAFSMFMWVILISGTVCGLIALIVVRPVCVFLGARGKLLEYSVLYARINLLSGPFYMVDVACQSFYSTAEKPRLGLFVTGGTGVLNICLDALFMMVFHWGLAGSAVATTLCEILGGIAPFLYFSRQNSSRLRLVRTRIRWKMVLKAGWNGMSQFLSNISSQIVQVVFNWQLLRMLGADGVAAFGAIQYLYFIFSSIFIGYSLGASALVSYHYGAQNQAELRNLRRKSQVIICVTGLLMFAIGQTGSGALTAMFASHDPALQGMMRHALRIVSFGFLLVGMNLFGAAFFTALGDGLIAAALSFARAIVFEVGFVLLLPRLLQTDGIWTSIPAAELASFLLVLFFLIKERKYYRY